ncbi:MAG: ArnT family glycosyltransferase [Phycisphaerae bacterium]
MFPQIRLPLLAVAVAFLLLALCRVFGPSDLYDKEQPRTAAYTADMLLHHRWILPTDSFDIPATKPPLFNWIDAPFVAGFGYHEWTLKFPSFLAAALVLFCIFRAARTMPPTSPTPADSPVLSPQNHTSMLATLAALMWLSTFMTAKLMYLARPDMLVTACLTVAWLTGTRIILQSKSHIGFAIVFWLSVAGAALTKGPIALLPIAYLFVAARLCAGSWQPLRRAGLWWGIPLILLMFGAWCLLAFNQHPTFFREVLVDREVSQRLLPTPDNPNHFGWLTTLPNGPIYIITRFLPWSLIPLAVLILGGMRYFATKPRPTLNLRHPLAPATLWVAVIALSFCFLTTKRPDRYAPTFPPLALISAWLALEYAPKLHLSFRMLVAATFAFLAVVILNNAFFDSPATTNLGDNLVQFTRAVDSKAGRDTILFEDGEQTPLQTLLGRHQPLTPSPDYLAASRWAIRFYDPGSPSIPVLTSAAIAQIDGPLPGRLALYPLTPGAGAKEFAKASKVPRLYADDDSSQLIANPQNPPRWVQFWRQHSPLPEAQSQATTAPASQTQPHE